MHPTDLLPFTWTGVVDSQHTDNQAASSAEVLQNIYTICNIVLYIHAEYINTLQINIQTLLE